MIRFPPSMTSMLALCHPMPEMQVELAVHTEHVSNGTCCPGYSFKSTDGHLVEVLEVQLFEEPNESKWIEIPQTDPWEWHFFFTLQEHCNTYLYYLILVPLELVLHLMRMFVSYHKDYAWQKLQREEWSVMAHWSLQDRKTPIFLEIAMPSFSGGCQEPPRTSKNQNHPSL